MGWLPRALDVRRLLVPFQKASVDAKRSFRRFEREMRRERKLSPEDVGVPYDAVALEAADGQELAGWYVPGSDMVRSVGTEDLGVFIFHHYGGQKATVLPWLELFHSVGISSLAVDARGHAGSSELQGEAAFAAGKLDVHAACDELRLRGARRLLLVGQSQGAAQVIAVAGAREDVVGVVVDSGPAPTMSLAIWGLAGQIMGTRRHPLARGILVADIFRQGDTSGYVADLWGGLRALRDRPLLWIHGDNDPVIPRGVANIWYRLTRPEGGGWTALTLSGGGHVQQPDLGSPLAKAVLSFVRRLDR